MLCYLFICFYVLLAVGRANGVCLAVKTHKCKSLLIKITLWWWHNKTNMYNWFWAVTRFIYSSLTFYSWLKIASLIFTSYWRL